MHEFKVRSLLNAMDVLVYASGLIHSKHPGLHPRMSDTARKDIAKHVREMIPEFEQSELSMCRISAERLIGTLESTDQSDRISTDLHELRRRILDQMTDTFCLLLSERERKLFEQETPFGATVEDQFPSASDDIYEASKCLALGRATACVMHLMRACEAALVALAGKLGVERQGDWGGYLRKIAEELDRRVKTSGKRTPDEQFYAEVAIGFEHLKRAWRNPTMHVDKTYSIERASEIFEAVRSFMSHAAKNVSESEPAS